MPIAPAAIAALTACTLSARVKPSVISATTASSSASFPAAGAAPPSGTSSAFTFSRSSSTMRSAVFFPRPLTEERVRTSAVAMATASCPRFMAERIPIPIFGPTPETLVSFKNIFFSSGLTKP